MASYSGAPERVGNGKDDNCNGAIDEVQIISRGSGHALAVRADGTVWAWGSNSYGQLGDGTTESRNDPERVEGGHPGVSVAAGGSHSAVLLADGTVHAWGRNDVGQLGDGTAVDQWTPVQVNGLDDVAGVWAWGSDAAAAGNLAGEVYFPD